LWVRALNSAAAQPLAGTEDAEHPFWSPDSRSIGFFAGGQLKRIDIAGGQAQALADAPAGRGGAWSPDGTILFAPANVGPLSRVSATGGATAIVTRVGQGQSSHRYPQFLPDGQRFLFFVQGSREIQGIYLGALDGGEPRRLVANDTAGAWLPPDRILFVRQGALVSMMLDVEQAELTGELVTIANPVGVDSVFNLAGLSVSPQGFIAYRDGGSEPNQLTWFGRDGTRVGTAGGSNLIYPELSPDDRHVALSRAAQGGGYDVWLMDLLRGGLTRFTFDPLSDGSPVWSPDGMRIAFVSNRQRGPGLYVKPSSGAREEELLFESTAYQAPFSWSPDGEVLLYVINDPKTTFDIWTYSFMSDGQRLPWLQTPFAETGAQFSPDGRWVAYQSNESGRFEIYVQPSSAGSAKRQISTDGGTMPRWRADGRELFFIASDAKLMAAAVTASTPAFDTASPVALFQTRIAGGAGQSVKPQYAVSRDGRFLINERVEESAPTPITLILNWQPRP
jgi:Tol biopolymer transport system component